MTYDQLSAELREKLEAKRFAMVRYSSAIGETGKVDDAILIVNGSAMDLSKLHGYSVGTPSVWFEFVTAGKSDEEAVKMVEESLAS